MYIGQEPTSNICLLSPLACATWPATQLVEDRYYSADPVFRNPSFVSDGGQIKVQSPVATYLIERHTPDLHMRTKLSSHAPHQLREL